MKTDLLLSESSNFSIHTEKQMDSLINNPVENKPHTDFLSFTELINELVKKQILIKLNKNMTYIADGRLIKFSNLIKQLSCNAKSFNHRLNLENLDKETFSVIMDFLEIVEWNREKFIFDIKMDELSNWYEYNKKNMNNIEEMSKYLKINHLFDYLKHRELIKNSK
jgi:hypothetical protein